MSDQIIEENERESQPPLVSVNSRGGTSAGIAGRVAFSMLILVMLVVGAVYGVNRYRAARAEQQAQATQTQKADQRGGKGNQPGRRVFSTDPPQQTEGTRTATDPATAGIQCSDGSSGRTLNGQDGRPMMASDGRQLRVCGNGQVLVPPASMPAAAPAVAAATGGTTVTAPAPRSNRYAGDILLPSRGDIAGPQPAARPAAVDTMAALAPPAEPAASATPSNTPPLQQGPSGAGGPLAPLLNVSSQTAVRASMLGDRDMILPQDRSIDCNLSMRLVSEVSGRTVCVLSSYVYGDSGRVVLLEPGTVASGEYVAMMAQGQRRLVILWTRLKTPRGVIIDLHSPAADALGTAGLDGIVDNRWPERIGAAFLLSMVQDAIGYQTARAASGNGGGGGNAAAGIAVFQHSTDTGNHLAEKVMESTINIKPTIYKRPGDRATIMVARDLDFGSVYDLRRK